MYAWWPRGDASSSGEGGEEPPKPYQVLGGKISALLGHQKEVTADILNLIFDATRRRSAEAERENGASKRPRALTAQLDILLSGSVEDSPRPAAQVWQELGLFREEHPVLLAGHVQIARSRSTGLIDAPYIGLPAATVLGVSSSVTEVITIENKTTFHSEAKRQQDDKALLVYTAGMPSPAWRAMYKRLLESLPPTTSVFHWGDVDEGGFRIASAIAAVANEAGFSLQPYGMSPGDVPLNMRVRASPRTLERIHHFACAAGWSDLGQAIREAEFVAEQEALERE